MLSQTHRIILALLMVAREPLTKNQATICLEENVDLDSLIAELNQFFEENALPMIIQPLADGYRLLTRSEYAQYITRLYQNRGRLRLSRSALETLAIIAYKQPVTKVEIDTIRGVDTNLKPLIEKNLIQIKGRQDGPGRPLLYGTTSFFLEYFGLKSLKDLPKLPEIESLTGTHESIGIETTLNPN